MKQQTALHIAGGAFILVGLLHLYRALAQIPVQFGSVSVPVFLSWIGLVVAGALATACFCAKE